jgi:hypothetical protein
MEIAGLGDVRPRKGTYGRYDFFALPSLPFELRGDWNWLRTAEPVERSIGEDPEQILSSFQSLRDAVAAKGLSLPNSFEQFLSEPSLAQRVRSNTDCFLDIGTAVAPSPISGGYLIRFLSDSQGCLFWYLYLATNGDHAVLSSSDLYGSTAEEQGFYSYVDGEKHLAGRKAENISFASASFEAFMCRFWIENEIWFAAYQKRENSVAGRQYAEAYERN